VSGPNTTVFKTRRARDKVTTTIFAAARPGVTYQNVGTLVLLQAEHDVLAKMVDEARKTVSERLGVNDETGE
jgi:uncharacterized lipoprotein YddW (UPF0748 family)